MIDSVPLIQNANDAQQINASIIAMKKASRELDEKIVKLNSLNSELDKKIALLDSGLNKEIEDRKEAINSLDVPSVGGSGKYISAISETDGKISATASDITSSVSSGNSQPVTSGGVATAIAGQSGYVSEINMTAVGWIKVCSIQNWSYGDILELYFTSDWASGGSSAKKITIAKGVTSGGGGFASWVTVKEEASDPAYLLSSLQVCGANSTEGTDKVFIYVYYNRAGSNTIRMSYKQSGKYSPTVYMTNESPSGYALTASYSLHTSGVFVNGSNVFMQRWGTVYSGSLYNSGYFLLAQAGQYYASTGNHDVGIHGTVDFCPASNHVSIEFDIFVRGGGNSVQRQMFTCLVVGGSNTAGFKDVLIATVEAINNTFIVRLYATIVGYWGRFNVNITKFWLGDVQQLSDMYNSNFIALPLTKVDTLSGTTITRTALN